MYKSILVPLDGLDAFQMAKKGLEYWFQMLGALALRIGVESSPVILSGLEANPKAGKSWSSDSIVRMRFANRSQALFSGAIKGAPHHLADNQMLWTLLYGVAGRVCVVSSKHLKP